MQILDLDQQVLGGKQGNLGIQFGQNVSGACLHLQLCEFKCPPGFIHRILLAHLLLGSLLNRSQCILDVAECRQHGFMVVGQQLGVLPA
jgi:hypothetical protein